MKILYVITGLGIGGAEAITIDIANKMLEKGNDVMLIFLSGENKQIHRIDPNIKLKALSMSKTPQGLLKALFKARKIVKKWQPDIVHSQMVHANLFCRFLRISCHIPFLICSEHSNNIEGRLRMIMYYLTDSLSDMNTNVSIGATNYFINRKAFSKQKSFPIYNGVDLSKFQMNKVTGTSIRIQYQISEDDFLFLTVGRLVPAKDQKNLINAFEILAKKYVNLKLLLIGEGELHNELANCIVQKKLSKNILLAGAHSNVADFYNAADCFVLSSAWEGFGIVLAEAMACELPVIATNVGGCFEVMNDDRFIVNPNDSLSLSQKMEQVYLLLPHDRKVLGHINRQKAERFDLEAICIQWLNIYLTKNKI